MMNANYKNNRFIRFVAVTLCILLVTGCSVLKRRDGTTAGDSVSGGGPKPVYLDFDDILIPADLKPDRARTFVFKIGALTAGVLVIKGRTPSETLVEFFENNMSRDNWKFVSSFRSPRSMLLFEKGTRWCVITITEDDFDHKTRVEIWVSPKTEDVESGLME